MLPEAAPTSDRPHGLHPGLSQWRWLNLAAVLLVSAWRGLFGLGLEIAGATYVVFAAFEAFRPAWAESSSGLRAARLTLDFLLPMLMIGLSGGFQSPLWWSLSMAGAAAALRLGLPAGAGLGAAGWLATGAVLALNRPDLGVDIWRVVWTTVSGFAGTAAITWLAHQAPAAGAAPAPAGSPASESVDNTLDRVLGLVSRAEESLDPGELALRVIELVETGLGSSRGSSTLAAGLWVGPFETGEWAGTRGFVLAPARTPPTGSAELGDLWTRGVPVTLKAPAADGFVGQWPGLAEAPWVVAIPLPMPPEELPAAVFIGRDEAVEWTPRQSELLMAMARQAGRVWHNASRYQTLLNERERFTELQEEARRRLARNLHDGPTQSIASIAMRANFARRQISRDPKVAAQEIAKVEEMARQTTREIRNMLFTLRPLILESQGLGPALYQLALKAREAEEEEINLEIDPEATAGLEPGVQGALFYIVEEAVHNVQKHAAAENIWIRIKQVEGGLRLEVEDDGVGFNVGAVDANYEQRGSLGMVNMRERAELAGGALGVRSTEGQGTCISVVLPVSEGDSVHHA